MKKTIAAAALLAASAASWAAASAFTVAYMSAEAGEPWDSQANVQAMDAAFGVGQWDRISFTDGYNGYAFVYIDGSDWVGTDFHAFVSANGAGLQNYVNGGGRLFLNAATNSLGGTTYDLGFGTSTLEGGSGFSSTGTLTAAGMPLSANGAGTSWGGNYFAHNAISSGLTTLITGQSGEAVLVGGTYGDGYVMIGGQTTTNFHSGVSAFAPLQLRVNELTMAAGVAAVPEPETYALLLAGLGAIIMLARRRGGTD